MRCNEILGQGSGNIRERVLDDFYMHQSFMSVMWIKDYTYMVIDDGKVPYVSSYILHIS